MECPSGDHLIPCLPPSVVVRTWGQPPSEETSSICSLRTTAIWRPSGDKATEVRPAASARSSTVSFAGVLVTAKIAVGTIIRATTRDSRVTTLSFILLSSLELVSHRKLRGAWLLDVL